MSFKRKRESNPIGENYRRARRMTYGMPGPILGVFAPDEMKELEKLRDEFVNTYRHVWGSNAGLSTERIKEMSKRDLEESIRSLKRYIGLGEKSRKLVPTIPEPFELIRGKEALEFSGYNDQGVQKDMLGFDPNSVFVVSAKEDPDNSFVAYRIGDRYHVEIGPGEQLEDHKFASKDQAMTFILRRIARFNAEDVPIGRA